MSKQQQTLSRHVLDVYSGWFNQGLKCLRKINTHAYIYMVDNHKYHIYTMNEHAEGMLFYESHGKWTSSKQVVKFVLDDMLAIIQGSEQKRVRIHTNAKGTQVEINEHFIHGTPMNIKDIYRDIPFKQDLNYTFHGNYLAEKCIYQAKKEEYNVAIHIDAKDDSISIGTRDYYNKIENMPGCGDSRMEHHKEFLFKVNSKILQNIMEHQLEHNGHFSEWRILADENDKVLAVLIREDLMSGNLRESLNDFTLYAVD